MAKKSKFGFLSTNALKLIAIASMIVDHIAVVFFDSEPLMRMAGRLAFPIFAFLIAEGVRHTSGIFRYGIRLLAFAVLSEVPYDLAFNGTVLEFGSQNVYFTLFLGLASAAVLKELQKRKLGILAVVSTFILGLAAAYLASDFGAMGVVVITLMYIFSDAAMSSRFAGFAVTGALTSVVYMPPVQFFFIGAQIPAALAAVPLVLYNGKRGRKMNKYVFYLVYPLHLLIIVLIDKILI